MLHVPQFIFIGGPAIHAGYVRRLFRAEAAGRLSFDRIVVVDRDPHCAVAALKLDRVHVEVAPWGEWLKAHLSKFDSADHLVPYHWAPHVLMDWLAAELAREGLILRRLSSPADPPASPPVIRSTAGGDLALSYAEWICPVACIEPALCPHTRGPKSWSLAKELSEVQGSFVFPCMHLTFGVGTIPMREILGVRHRILDGVRAGLFRDGVPLWITSASHCHGLAARAEVRRA